jgi:hypothetical protein
MREAIGDVRRPGFECEHLSGIANGSGHQQGVRADMRSDVEYRHALLRRSLTRCCFSISKLASQQP